MITCTKTGNSFSVNGLNASDLEVIQDGIIRLFNESNRAEHSKFRRQVLEINAPIDKQLEIINY